MGGYSNGFLNTPNFNAWVQTAWGAGSEYWSAGYAQWFGAATNLVFGQNPPYFLDDFKAVYPKFFGLPTAISGCGTTQGSNVVTVPNLLNVDFGQFIQAWGVLPKGTVVTGIGDGTVTLNNNALVTNANATINFYQASPIPIFVIQMYVNLAYASLVQARWQEMWFQAMALFVAHYATLYAKSDASEVFETLQTSIHGEVPVGVTPGSVYTLSSVPPGGALQALIKNGLFQTPGIDYTLVGASINMTVPTVDGDALFATWPIQTQAFTASQPNGATIASMGLAGGIQSSKSVGDVSVSYQVLVALEDWGAWNLTSYGQLLSTQARVIGSGPCVIW